MFILYYLEQEMRQFNVNAIATYENEKVVMGGNFTPINSTTQGYLLQVNKYGYVLWSNSIIIKNDSVSDVVTVKILNDNDIYALVIYQDPTPFTDVFLVKFSMYGVLNNSLGLNFPSMTASIKSFSVIDSNNFNIIFYYTSKSISDGSTLYNTLISLVSMSQINTTYGFSSSSDQFSINIIKTANTSIFLSGIVSSKLFITKYSISSLLQSSFLNNTYYLQPSISGFNVSKDMIDLRLYSTSPILWVIASDSSSSIVAVKLNQTTLASISAFSLSGFQQLQSITLQIINENNIVISTYSGASNGNRIVNLILSSDTTASIAYQKDKGVLNSPYYISLASSNSMLVMSSTIFKGESTALNGNQIIILKTKTADFSFDFNCYSIPITNDISVQNIVTSSTQASLFEQALLNESTTLPNWIIVDNTIPSVVIQPSLFQTTDDISNYSGLITIQASTSTAYVVTSEFNTTITFTNNPPKLNVTTDVGYPDSVIERLSEGFQSSFKYQVLDDEYDILQYTITPTTTGISSSISFNNQSYNQYLIVTWKPFTSQIGTYNLTLSYTDLFHQKSLQTLYLFFNVTQNLPPTFNNQLMNITLREGLSYTYILPTPIDFEGENITLAYQGVAENTSLSSWIVYNNTNAPTIIINSKCGSAPLTLTPIFKLTDASGKSATENFTISITVNSRPTINTIDNINMTVPIFRTPPFSNYIRDTDTPIADLKISITYGSNPTPNSD